MELAGLLTHTIKPFTGLHHEQIVAVLHQQTRFLQKFISIFSHLGLLVPKVVSSVNNFSKMFVRISYLPHESLHLHSFKFFPHRNKTSCSPMQAFSSLLSILKKIKGAL
jgi:hypothetical protein